MRRDFPHSCNGVEAPRLVVFEVINLKACERGSPWSRLHELSFEVKRFEVKPFALVWIWPSA
jgi:hypothetical protein